MKIKLKSLIYEEEILKDFLKDKKTLPIDTHRKLIAYTKYLKKQGKSRTEIRNELEDVMEKYYIGFVLDDWDNTLSGIVTNNTKKENLEYRKVKPNIHINYEELEYIKSQDDIELEKMLFIMLGLSKLEVKEDAETLSVNSDRRYIFALSHYKYKKGDREEQRGLAIYDLRKRGFLNRSYIAKYEKLFLNYGDNINIKEGIDLELTQENIENVVVAYLDWRQKEDYYYCKVCGKEIKKAKKGRTPDYCTSCKKQIEQEQHNKRQRKYDEKRKSDGK